MNRKIEVAKEFQQNRAVLAKREMERTLLERKALQDHERHVTALVLAARSHIQKARIMLLDAALKTKENTRSLALQAVADDLGYADAKALRLEKE